VAPQALFFFAPPRPPPLPRFSPCAGLLGGIPIPPFRVSAPPPPPPPPPPGPSLCCSVFLSAKPQTSAILSPPFESRVLYPRKNRASFFCPPLPRGPLHRAQIGRLALAQGPTFFGRLFKKTFLTFFPGPFPVFFFPPPRGGPYFLVPFFFVLYFRMFALFLHPSALAGYKAIQHRGLFWGFLFLNAVLAL